MRLRRDAAASFCSMQPSTLIFCETVRVQVFVRSVPTQYGTKLASSCSASSVEYSAARTASAARATFTASIVAVSSTRSASRFIANFTDLAKSASALQMLDVKRIGCAFVLNFFHLLHTRYVMPYAMVRLIAPILPSEPVPRPSSPILVIIMDNGKPAIFHRVVF